MKQSRIADKGTSLPDVLNAFYAQFEQNASGMVSLALTTLVTPVPTVTAADVRSVFLRDSLWKTMGLDGVPGRALRSCADQLAEVFIDIFNLSLRQGKVPNCFKKIAIIPVPKQTHAMCTNDYRPIALTSIIMKCFERPVMAYINI
eukprot:g31186.t1